MIIITQRNYVRERATERRRLQRVLRYSLFALGVAVLILGGIWYYLSGGRYVTTDDAYVQANVLTVSTDVSGIVDQTGQFLASGGAAFGLVQTNGMWVAAEPKETALTYAHPGQAANVTVDTYPNETWHGRVQSIARATDREFSVLPAQNSFGNWVKVVQRMPVRIDIKPDRHQPPLSAGTSVEVSIDTHHQRTLADLF